jgi:hypothetical protein
VEVESSQDYMGRFELNSMRLTFHNVLGVEFGTRDKSQFIYRKSKK